MGHWTYLAIDLGALCVPLLFSFHPGLRFHEQWWRLWPTLVAVSAVFIAWDAAFARMGVWGFNARYITGCHVFGLPLEEVLFFVCIPYACMFTYHCFGIWLPDPWRPKLAERVGAVLGMGLVILGVMGMGRWYTVTALTAMGCLLLYATFFAKPLWMGRSLTVYLILLVPFSVVNGLLTGSWLEEAVVLYNDAENLGLRLGTIPVEDVFYGLLLFTLVVALYEKMGRRTVERS